MSYRHRFCVHLQPQSFISTLQISTAIILTEANQAFSQYFFPKSIPELVGQECLCLVKVIDFTSTMNLVITPKIYY